jgi:hypothetical protein
MSEAIGTPCYNQSMAERSRRRLMRITVTALGALGLLAVGAFGFISRVHWEFDCENSPLRESLSPDGARKIVVFERSCGATTDFSTQASLLKSDRTLPSGAGNLYIADTNHGTALPGPGGGPALKIRWKTPQSVILTSAAGARVFLARQRIEDVQIEYGPDH